MSMTGADGGSQSVLGALQIMIGVFSYGLGFFLISSGVGVWYMLENIAFPIWLFITWVSCGVGSIILMSNIGDWYVIAYTGFPIWFGILFIIVGIASISSEGFPSPCLVFATVILNLCGVAFAITAIVLYSVQLTTPEYSMFFRNILILMIVLSNLELCLAIGSATLGIKALRQRQSTTNKSTPEPELYKPLLETTNPTV